MKWIATTVLLLFCSALKAQEPVPLAHGNVPGEPHHHLKIENEYVRVYYVEAPPHENTLLHQHDHDYIYISLGPSDVVNAIVNKPEIHLQHHYRTSPPPRRTSQSLRAVLFRGFGRSLRRSVIFRRKRIRHSIGIRGC